MDKLTIRMIKIQSFEQFRVDHLTHSVVPILAGFLGQFIVFINYELKSSQSTFSMMTNDL